ncbi:MAG: sigma 54-interacting transcriptional regulator [Labilithrix sp.]|nr:sigma 54-interacting transcriptional regulator [Labilithrix sp.]
MSSFSEDRTHPRPLGDSAAGEAKLMVLWPGGWTSRSLADGEILVGRSQECDVRIDDASVSRKHVRVHGGSALSVEDLGSSNGTRVRGRLLAPNERVGVAPGDLVEVGNAMLMVQPAAPPASARGTDTGAPTSAHARRAAVVTGEMTVRPVHPAPESQAASVARLVELVAASNLSVVLLGETGVGKEVSAERIHALSARRSGPFVRINCAALTDTLLETELFGHERGAFTGAVKTKVGLLEAAHGGTVLLDEVGEMPQTTQAKLLRVLESREVMRVGSVEARPIDVRILAATNRDLPALVASGAFRSDLYFRLDGITIRLPPLRERRAEILPIATSLLATASKGSPPSMSAEAIARLESYAWPGNVRELRNVIERAVVLSAGGPIEVHHLFVETISLPPPAGASAPPVPAGAFATTVMPAVPASAFANAVMPAAPAGAFATTVMPAVPADAFATSPNAPTIPPAAFATTVMPAVPAGAFATSPNAPTIPPAAFATTVMPAVPAGAATPAAAAPTGDLRADVEGYERARIEEALAQSGGNQTRAAALLGISRRTLVSRLEAYGFPRPRKDRAT